MRTLTIRVAEDRRARLCSLVGKRGVSLNKPADELCTIALPQHDTEARFRARASRGSAERLLQLLDKLDRGFAGR